MDNIGSITYIHKYQYNVNIDYIGKSWTSSYDTSFSLLLTQKSLYILKALCNITLLRGMQLLYVSLCKLQYVYIYHWQFATIIDS